MALNKKPTFVNRPKLGIGTLSSAVLDVTLVTGGASGNKVTGIFATGEETASRDITLSILRTPDTTILWTVAVPSMAGREAATPPVDLFTAAVRALLPTDGDSQPYLFLEEGDILQASVPAVTATEDMAVHVVHGEFDDEVA